MWQLSSCGSGMSTRRLQPERTTAAARTISNERMAQPPWRRGSLKPPETSTERSVIASAELVFEAGQAVGLILVDQRVDDVVERLALHDLGQVVEGQVDAVVGDPRLRIVVGADTLRTIAGADLALAGVRARLVQGLTLHVVETRLQVGHGLSTVLVLRLFLGSHHHARRQVGDADGGVGLVDVLGARAARAVGVETALDAVDDAADVLGPG